MLYFAYGLNTHFPSMAIRCPDARVLGPAQLPKHRFCFRFHADIDIYVESIVDGLLWEISDTDLNKLDNFEGYPDYYQRYQTTVIYNQEPNTAWVYTMVDKTYRSKPDHYYLETCVRGYLDNQLSLVQIITALEEINGKHNEITTY